MSRTLSLQIARDVRVAWLDANDAFRRLDVTARMVAEATEALRLAQARYDNSLGQHRGAQSGSVESDFGGNRGCHREVRISEPAGGAQLSRWGFYDEANRELHDSNGDVRDLLAAVSFRRALLRAARQRTEQPSGTG